MSDQTAATAPVAPPTPSQSPAPVPAPAAPTDRIGGAVARAEAAAAAEAAKAPQAPATAPANDAGKAPPVANDKAPEEPQKAKNDYQTSLQNLRENRQLSAQRKALAREQASVRQQVEQARQYEAVKGTWKEKGPVAFLEASGIPVGEFGPAMIQYMLNNQAPPPPDPVELKVLEQIKPIKEELEKERAARAQAQEQQQIAAWVASNIRPLIDPEKHEVFVKMQGGVDQAAVFAFHQWNAHRLQNNGEQLDPASTVQQIADYFDTEYDKAIEVAKAMKRFAKVAVPVVPPPANGSASRIAPTLSNNQNQAPSNTNGTLQRRSASELSREDRVAAVLAKHGLK